MSLKPVRKTPVYNPVYLKTEQDTTTFNRQTNNSTLLSRPVSAVNRPRSGISSVNRTVNRTVNGTVASVAKCLGAQE